MAKKNEIVVKDVAIRTMHNLNFNPLKFEGFRKEAGLNAFTLSPARWIEATNVI